MASRRREAGIHVSGPRTERLAVDSLRRYEGRMIDPAKFLSRLLLVLILLPLADCAGGTSSADLAPAAPQAEAPPAEPAPSAPANAKKSKSRNAKAAPPAATEPAPAPAPASTQVTGPVVMTPEKIKADCWMKYEEDKKIKNIDQRLALVEKCIDETSRNQPPQRN